MPRLLARGLACRRGSRRLFAGLELALWPAELLWLRGRNGSGKTSLLRAIAGLAAPERGQLLIDGEPAAARRGGVFIGHANALKDELTVAESLEFLLRLHGFDGAAARIDIALDYWNLLRLRAAPVRTLSQGQRRRLALARLVVEEHASLWLLDEPFDALDTDGIERLNALLADHLRRDGSVLLTSHPRALAPGLPLREFDLDRCAC
jgi:heme exporter protein A